MQFSQFGQKWRCDEVRTAAARVVGEPRAVDCPDEVVRDNHGVKSQVRIRGRLRFSRIFEFAMLNRKRRPGAISKSQRAKSALRNKKTRGAWLKPARVLSSQ